MVGELNSRVTRWLNQVLMVISTASVSSPTEPRACHAWPTARFRASLGICSPSSIARNRPIGPAKADRRLRSADPKIGVVLKTLRDGRILQW
eukprot:1195615-Prorocentrum_minimum.AAC.3